MDVTQTKDSVLIRPGMSVDEILKTVRNTPGVFITSTGMRDAGQSDYKNRIRIHDLATLTPSYNQMGLFSVECHGGARWHVGVMNRRESPFEELRILREQMPNVLLQTLIRETNLWGYRPYTKNVIEHVVAHLDLDVWRCFSFLNDIRNMRTVAEVVMKRGRLFEPCVSLIQSDWTTDDYYLSVVHDIVDLCGGTSEIILCIKDMAGVGSPKRIGNLVDAIKQHYPDLVIQYHRHTTDGLAIPSLAMAAKSGAEILDAEEDTLARFYGQAPILGLQAYLEEMGIPVNIDRHYAEKAVQKVREWISHYEWAESPFKGFDHEVIEHRMPGGAFPSSFEQAEKGGFLPLMPAILNTMSLYNKIVKYFDVTPGSQITWVTCSGIINKYHKEQGMTGVEHVIHLLTKFVIDKKQDFSAMTEDEQQELLELFRSAPGDFQNLILGRYGKLPMGWPADWVYHSAFGDGWEEKIKARQDISPLDLLPPTDAGKLRDTLAEEIGREANDEEFILYLMHPKDAIAMIAFRDEYGEAPLVLPTGVWLEGLKEPGDLVDFEFAGKPHRIELVSCGKEQNGMVPVVLRVDNRTRTFSIVTEQQKDPVRMAKGANEVGAPINGNVWRLGNPDQGPIETGAIVQKGQEIANLEAMKMENAILAPFAAKLTEICVNLNDTVEEGQILFVLEPS
ncbi:MAG: biotin/lipoyl-containing protein [Candidatus Bipolaricaulota bacterium]|nr:biotin/lipoyl-containing protein [Candidatus Bipolaricaulota bacterium]